MKIEVSGRYLAVSSVVVLWLLVFSAPSVFAQMSKTAASDTNPAISTQKASAPQPSDEMNESAEEKIPPPTYDPLIKYNRLMTRFNDKLYVWVFKPVATGYAKAVPEPARLSVDRFFKNLGYPMRVVNDILQLNVKQAGVETTRFLVNSTVGVAGFFDPAKAWLHLHSMPSDFGLTLGHYGVTGGFPLVLPFYGPSNLRDTLAMVPDYFLDPISYLPDSADVGGINMVIVGVQSYRRVNSVSLRLGAYEQMKNSALDWYIFLRNAYHQHREMELRELSGGNH